MDILMGITTMTIDEHVPQYMRLKDNHPVMVKLAKLYDLAEELGIHISFYSQAAIVQDEGYPYHFRMENLDSGEAVGEWPPPCEYKLTYENPKYVAFREQEREAEEAARRDIAEKKRLEEEARKKAEEEMRLKRIEDAERKELARLKAKYDV
jgi:hypothetical protein